MKRDWNVVWDILTRTEAVSGKDGSLSPKDFKLLDLHVVGYHVALLSRAGFIDADVEYSTKGGSVKDFKIYGLTWRGHEVLEAFRASWSSWRVVGITPSIEMVMRYREHIRDFFEDPKMKRSTRVEAPI